PLAMLLMTLLPFLRVVVALASLKTPPPCPGPPGPWTPIARLLVMVVPSRVRAALVALKMPPPRPGGPPTNPEDKPLLTMQLVRVELGRVRLLLLKISPPWLPGKLTAGEALPSAMVRPEIDTTARFGGDVRSKTRKRWPVAGSRPLMVSLLAPRPTMVMLSVM